MRGFDPFVMHNAESWSDGIKKYKAEKSRCCCVANGLRCRMHLYAMP